MEQAYIKLSSGELVPDRRSNSMDLQQSLAKLIGKVESMENNIEIKLDSVKDKIVNLDQKVFDNLNLKSKQIENLEKKIDTHCEDEDSIDEVLDAHDKKWEVAKQYISRILSLEKKYSVLEDRVSNIEKAPLKTKATLVDNFGKVLMTAAMIALSSVVIGSISMLMIQYIKTL